jgi:hypothetical protein
VAADDREPAGGPLQQSLSPPAADRVAGQVPDNGHRCGADGALPVMKQVHDEARRRKIELVVLPTAEVIGVRWTIPATSWSPRALRAV